MTKKLELTYDDILAIIQDPNWTLDLLRTTSPNEDELYIEEIRQLLGNKVRIYFNHPNAKFNRRPVFQKLPINAVQFGYKVYLMSFPPYLKLPRLKPMLNRKYRMRIKLDDGQIGILNDERCYLQGGFRNENHIVFKNETPRLLTLSVKNPISNHPNFQNKQAYLKYEYDKEFINQLSDNSIIKICN